jgi:hypothetical protein
MHTSVVRRDSHDGTAIHRPDDAGRTIDRLGRFSILKCFIFPTSAAPFESHFSLLLTSAFYADLRTADSAAADTSAADLDQELCSAIGRLCGFAVYFRVNGLRRGPFADVRIIREVLTTPEGLQSFRVGFDRILELGTFVRSLPRSAICAFLERHTLVSQPRALGEFQGFAVE